MRNPLLLFSTSLFAKTAFAQVVTSIAPAGYDTVPGGHANAIPWWAGSAVYMQVHDALDLQQVLPVPMPLLKALSLRRPIEGSDSPARTLDVQVTLGTTAVSAQSASTEFAQNLGPRPTVVLPYTRLSLPALTPISVPNPQRWFFPFANAYRYGIAGGNLCWELRIKNLSKVGTGACDAMSGADTVYAPLLGRGCTAAGQNVPAGIGLRTLDLGRGTFAHRLDHGRANSVAALLIGTEPANLLFPGACAALELVPLLTISGKTDATGTWLVSLTDTQIGYWSPQGAWLTQFAFVDPRLPYGFGLSDCSTIRVPTPHIARIWAAPYASGQGNEIATAGQRDTHPYGLITGFDS